MLNALLILPSGGQSWIRILRSDLFQSVVTAVVGRGHESHIFVICSFFWSISLFFYTK